MKRKNPEPPVTRGQQDTIGQPPAEGDVPDQVEVLDDGMLRRSIEQAHVTLLKSRAEVEAVFKRAADLLFTPGHLAEALACSKEIDQFFLFKMGSDEDLQVLAKNPDTELYLDESLDRIEKNENLIRFEAPRALKGVVMQQVSDTRAHRKAIRDHKEWRVIYNRRVDALDTHLDGWLYKVCRQVWKGTTTAVQLSFDLFQALIPLNNLFTARAQKGQETHKDHLKVEQQVIAGLGHDPGKTPAPPAGGTTPAGGPPPPPSVPEVPGTPPPAPHTTGHKPTTHKPSGHSGKKG